MEDGQWAQLYSFDAVLHELKLVAPIVHGAKCAHAINTRPHQHGKREKSLCQRLPLYAPTEGPLQLSLCVLVSSLLGSKPRCQLHVLVNQGRVLALLLALLLHSKLGSRLVCAGFGAGAFCRGCGRVSCHPCSSGLRQRLGGRRSLCRHGRRHASLLSWGHQRCRCGYRRGLHGDSYFGIWAGSWRTHRGHKELRTR